MKHIAMTTAALFVALTSSRAFADDMSDMASWCATQANAPSSIVICSDLELRRLAALRNKIIADARTYFPPDEMKEISQEQNDWVHEYTAACGVSVNGPPVSVPVPPYVVDCYRRKGQERVDELVEIVREVVPGYQAPRVTGVLTPEQLETQRQREQQEEAARRQSEDAARMEQERREAMARIEKQKREQEEAAAAAEARRKLQQEAANEQRARLLEKMKSLGFQLVSPIDLDLDWRTYVTSNTKIALRGIYVEQEDVEGLSLSGNRDLPFVRLYTQGASRDTRKVMLECRNSNFASEKCRMIVGATVRACTRNKGQLNEKEVPCLGVIEAFVLPEGTPLADSQ